MFKDILLNLLRERELTQRQLSRLTDIPTTTINGWLTANRLPDYYSLQKLSALLDISADYLLGLSEYY